MDGELGTSEQESGVGWRRALAAAIAGIVALALVILIAMVSLSNEHRDRALAAQEHSAEVMILARTLESTLLRSEAALGRYVISGTENPQVGRYYFEEWRRAGQIIDQMMRETRQNERQQALLRSLREHYNERGKELAATAIRTTYGQNLNALAKFYEAGKAESLVRIADTLEQIIATERSVLERRTGAATQAIERSNRLTRVLSAFGVVIVMFALGLGWTTLHAITQRRLARRDTLEVARHAADLEAAVADRTAELRQANDALRAEAAERAHAEAQLRQIQKMEAVGQLTGGIAHDFNNMLAVVIGGLELARRRLADRGADAMRHIDNAMEGANRAAALTRRLLAFARSEPLLPESVDANALIAGMSDLLDRTLGERIEVRTEFDPNAWPVFIDRHQLENAVLNLAVNARDAMEGEGVLTISTGNETVEGVEHREYLRVSVSDTGCGMSPEVMERAFEPFFTTKPVGKGTGLGLSQIFGFVRQSRGEVRIDSAPGQGTRVSLLLPRHAAAVETTAAPASPEPALAAAGGLAILVVEDDPRVLDATIDALIELGHRPVACDAPEKAAELMANHPDIRLILTDVIMPGMSGPELVASLRPNYPEVGILFVTGFAGDVDEAGAFGGHDLLRKPFTIGALARAVDEAIKRSSGSRRFEAAEAAK